MSSAIQRSNPHQTLTPAPWVVHFAALIAPGSRVLDLACGYGRNARYLAGIGHRVVAVDRDQAALAALAALSAAPGESPALQSAAAPESASAAAASTAAAPATPAGAIETIHADLEQNPWPFGSTTFDAIVVTHYLHRPLFPHILAALDPAGVLIYETFASGNEAYGRPSNPDFLLQPGELLERFSGSLQVIAFEQGFVAQPFEAVVQRICAIGRRRDWPQPLP